MHYCVWRQSCSDSHLLCWGHNIPLSTSSTTTGPPVESLTFVLLVCHCPPYCPPYCCCAALTQHNFHCPTGLFSNHDVLHCVCTCCDVHFRIVLCVCVLCRALFCSYRSVLYCPLFSPCLHVHCLYNHVSLHIQFLATITHTHLHLKYVQDSLSPCLTVADTVILDRDRPVHHSLNTRSSLQCQQL